MRFSNNQNWQEYKERMTAFWNCSVLDRVCISVRAPIDKNINISPFKFSQEYYDAENGLKAYWTDAVQISRRNIEMMKNTYFGGESVPSIFLNFGTSGHCQYYGARPVYMEETVWFEPISEEFDPDKLKYRPEILDQHISLASELQRLADGKYYIGMPDHCGTIDALAHLYGPENILYAMIDDPFGLKNAIELVNDGWRLANESFYSLLYDCNQGAVHSWMDLWAPSRLMQIQCDFSVMISTEMYNEFVMPELEQQLEWIEYPVYHFDGVEQIRHLDSILSLKKLKAIQWTHVAGQPAAKHYIQVLKRIQKAGKALIVMTPAEDMSFLLNELSIEGLYLHCETDNVFHAKEIEAIVKKSFV